MSELAIRGEKLGKRYRIGERQRYLALRDILTQTVKAPLRLFRAGAPKSSSNGVGHIWALKTLPLKCAKAKWWASSGAMARAKARC